MEQIKQYRFDKGCIQYIFTILFRFRQDLNLLNVLDTEIWKASCFINQKSPAKDANIKYEGWNNDFGVEWQKEASTYENI